jgi:hypothetical protein
MNPIPDEILKTLRLSPVQDWATWVAQDGDGSWWAYKAEPLHNNRGWYENEIGIFKKLGQSEAPEDWTAQIFKVEAVLDQTR